MTVRRAARRALRWLARGSALVLALYLVARAAVELTTVDPGRPESYRQDWGGPSYAGVLLVHAGPAVLVLLVAALLVRRHSQHGSATRSDARDECRPEGS